MALDPYYNNVSLLLPMEGLNAFTGFQDFSPTPKTVTPFGNAKISTTQSKWGNGSGYFDGAGDYLQIPSSDMVLGTSDFTVEWYAYFNYASQPTSFASFFINGTAASSAGDWEAFVRKSDGTGTFRFGGTTANDLSFPATPANTWTHYAVTRSGTTWKSFFNGTLQTTRTVSANLSGTTTLQIAAGASGATAFLGYIQDLRITKGAARYTANFTPPGRLVIPRPLFMHYPLATITGNVIVSGNGGAQLVVVRDVASRELITKATPNATTGAWTAAVPPGDYDITYFAPSCQPVCHGPYTVTA